MTGRFLRRAAGALIVIALLAGCGGGAKLNTMDAEFKHLYLTQLTQSAQDEKSKNVSVVTVAVDFDELRKRATKAGKEALKKDWRTAVAFYRIAALSAWQAGERSGGHIFEITEAGQELCNKHPGGAPRDCALMSLIPPFAVHDDLAKDLRPIQAKEKAQTALDTEDLATLKTVFDDVKRQFDKVSDVRDATKNTSAPPGLLTYIDRQRFLIFCTAQAAHDAMLSAGATGSAAWDGREGTKRSMKETATKDYRTGKCPE